MSKKSESPKIICLVGCGKQKFIQAALAKDIYTSPFFRNKRQYAERIAGSWFIVSAKHHLLHPDKMIEPYDEALTGAGVAVKKAWAGTVSEQLRKVANPKDTIIILAGKDYFEYLLPLIAEFNIELPLKGMRQGEQNKWLKAHLAKGRDHGTT